MKCFYLIMKRPFSTILVMNQIINLIVGLLPLRRERELRSGLVSVVAPGEKEAVEPDYWSAIRILRHGETVPVAHPARYASEGC